MTLEQAVVILNREKHDGSSEWIVAQRGWHLVVVLEGDEVAERPAQTLSPAEAVAIAERYERKREVAE